MDVTSLMRRSALLHAGHPAVIHRDRAVPFAEAWDRAVRVANGLLALGLRPGDRIGVLETNSLGAADLFAGAAVAGLVRVPLYPRNARASHVHMLGHTGCRAVVVSDALAGELDDVGTEVPTIEHVLVRDGGYEDWLRAQSADDPLVPVAADDLFVIRHTGGTTGLPKGVAYSHRSWLAAGRDWFYLFPPMTVGDRCMHVGPISHGSGYFFVPTWLHGGCNVLLDAFDAGEVLALIERERIAYGFMVPTMLNALVHHPAAAGTDLSSIRCLQIGGAPISDETALRAHRLLGDVLWQGYGQTEAVPVTMMGPREWFADVPGSEPLRSCGRPLPFADIEIRDLDTGAAVPLGGAGEITVRCDGQMTAFWDDPEATAERMVDGWVRTGDVGRIDANGYVYVLDRANDLIISGGFNIYPAEIENAAASVPGVIEAAAFGIPDDRWGETPCVVCSVAPGSMVTEEQVRARCAELLGSYKRPGRVVLTTEALPKSAVGKLARKALREPFWAGHDRRVAGS
jgi:acyl-CoA synthetase (AMP-forming)/AMP-acid ligase II